MKFLKIKKIFFNVLTWIFSFIIFKNEPRCTLVLPTLERDEREERKIQWVLALFLSVSPVRSWSCALATPSSPWRIAQWITNRWLHLWGESTQSRQLLPTGDKQSSAGASPDESLSSLNLLSYNSLEKDHGPFKSVISHELLTFILFCKKQSSLCFAELCTCHQQSLDLFSTRPFPSGQTHLPPRKVEARAMLQRSQCSPNGAEAGRLHVSLL